MAHICRFFASSTLSFLPGLLSVAFIWIAPSPGEATVLAADDPNIRYTGRVDFVDPEAPRLSWPGTSIRARFEGTSLAATFDDDNGNNYVAVVIDGGPPTTFRLPQTATSLTLASGLADGTHEVEIVKKTEGCCGAGAFSFLGFELDAGKNLAPLPPRPSLRLEFYGDSNPAGYSCECTCDSGSAQFKSAYDAYPAVVSRLLGAEYHSMSWSGIGISSGFTSRPMPGVWNRVIQESATPIWDFAGTPPDAVVINLGANDYYTGATSSEILQAWQAFVTDQLRPVYPAAHIVFANAYGWAFGEPADFVHLAVEGLHAAGDSNVSFVRFPWLWGQEHAVVCEQAGFADRVAAHLAEQLGLAAPEPLESSCLGDPGEITNGGFENLYNGEPSRADGWRPFTESSGTAELIEDPASARTGLRYNQLSTVGSGLAGVSQSTGASQGETFSASVWLRSPTGSLGVLALEFKDQGQNLVLEETLEHQTLDSWELVSITGTAPAGTWQVAVVIRLEQPSAILQVDDAILRGPAVFADGFESGNTMAWSSSVGAAQ